MTKQNRIFLPFKVWAALLFILSCTLASFANTDFSHITTETPHPIKLERTSKPENKAVLNIKANQPASPEVQAGETILDSLSKYFYTTNTQTSEETPKEEVIQVKTKEDNNENFVINPVNDAFTPPQIQDEQPPELPKGKVAEEENTSKEIVEEQSVPAEIIPDEEIAADKEIEPYSAALTNYDEPEGKIISSVTIEGLLYLKPEKLYPFIKTKAGDVFSTEALQEDLQNIYSSGYFKDNMSITPSVNASGEVDLVFELQENILVKDVQIIGNTVVKTEDLEPFVKSLKNLPQNIDNINKAIEQINNFYNERGYILAKVKNVDDDSDGNLKFYISEGTINNIVIEGNAKTKNYVIMRNVFTEPGTVYNEEQLKKDISKIYATNIFKDVSREIVPVENGEKGEYDVKLIVKEASSNSVSIGAGVDNALGLFGQLRINENNFLGRGQRISLSGLLGSGVLLSDASIKSRMNYQLELSFFEPYFLNADNSLTSKLYYRDLGSYQVPLAIERRFGLMANVDHKVKGQENLTTSLSAGFEHISLKEGDYNKIAEMYAKNNLDIALRKKELTGGTYFNIAPGIKYSSIDTNENPRDGIIASAKYQEAIGIDNIHHSNGRLIGSATKYFPIAKQSSLALTARGGIKVHGSDLPEVMAMSLGGPYTIRGFRMNGVGSGDGFIMGSVELATPIPFMDKLKYDFFKKIRFTAFVDAGRVYDGTISSKLYNRPMSAITIGVGLKFYIPNVGPISIDYGIPLTNPGKYGSKAGYFTFGTSMLDMYGY